ncbi:ATPase, T2SS/T4P/T4SS family [Clostridium akagii]|uniref:ATPase, T2SS/T4P/T4SS family n=1 Tax=Clostridium akagii TaxID=91623 RepID=UPI00047D5C2D|nr:ATPase, T2SS/T4P/T4SS family [Clostridium akagii]
MFKKKIENKDIVELKSNGQNELVLDEKGFLKSVINDFITEEAYFINLINRKLKPKSDLKNKVRQYLTKKKYKFNEDEFDLIYKKFELRTWSYGIINDLIENHDEVYDIRLINKDNIRVKYLGGRKTSDVKFESKEAFNDFILNFVTHKNDIILSEIDNMQSFADTTTSERFILRIDIVGNCLTKDDPVMHIRKLPKEKDLLPDLKLKGMLNEELVEHFKESMEAGLGILICGPSGSGKTIFFNALLEEIPHNKAGLVVQENEELFSKSHPEIVTLSVSNAKGDSKTHYSLAEILQKHALLGGYDYLMVGEIKGEESWDLSNAAFTGHIPITSVHVFSSKAAPDRLVDLMKYSKHASGMSYGSLLSTLVGFDEIVFMEDFKIKEVTQIAGYSNETETLELNPIYEYKLEEDKYIPLNEDCNKVKSKLIKNRFNKNKMKAVN